MRRHAAVLACLAMVVPVPAGATNPVTITPVIAAPYVGVGMYFGVDVTVRNVSGATVSFSGPPSPNNLDQTRLQQVSAGVLAESSGSYDLAPGAEVTVRSLYLALRAGATGMTFVVWQSGAPVQLGSGTVSFTVKNASDLAGAAAPAQGRMQIRGNIIRVSNDGRSTDRAAYIVLHGDPGGQVRLRVWGAGRTSLGKLVSDAASYPISGSNGDTFTLDGNGWAGIGWNGQVGGKPLDSGSYWIVATGAVVDRKPFLIARHQ